MLKATMLASLIAGVAMISTGAVNSEAVKAQPRDAQIIVEVARDKDTLTEEGITNTQDAVINNIKKYVTTNFSVLSRYKNTINAFAISINKDQIELVKQVPGVLSVTLNEMHWKQEIAEDGAYLSTTSEGAVQGEYGGEENISAITMHKPDDTADGVGTSIAILDNEFYFRGAVKNADGSITPAWNHETFSPLAADVPLKHTSRPKGYGSTIAATLLKQSAPLGQEGSLYFNNKVPFYFDYGGEIEVYSSDPVMDLDVSSDLTYHGSHVASIASGNADTYKGIAPKAQLFCMKVFTTYKASSFDKFLGLSSYSGAYDLPILNALEDCITLGVDGINMSLGSNLNDFDKDSATRKVLSKLIDSGIMTSISAGNSGKTSFSQTGAYANWTKDMVETGILSGYANDEGAMTIAAGQPTQIFYETGFDLNDVNVAYSDQIVNSEGYQTEYDTEYKTEDLFKDASGGYTKSVDWVYIPGFGRAADYTGLSVNGKLAVVNRGSTNFSDKYNIAASKGAIGLVIINNDPTSNDFNFRCSFGDGFSPSMPCALVLYKDKPLFENKKSGTINLIRKKLVDNPYAYTVSTFSTDGATYDLDLKPEITAPGENIRGAVPPQKTEDRTEERKYHVYEYLSGTSMSAPNYAGSQSLILSKEASKYTTLDHTPSKSEKEKIAAFRDTVNMRLMSTAEPMKEALKNPEESTDSKEVFNISSPRKQGAGMVNLAKAYNTNVYLEGYDLQGNPIRKSKIALRNNADINKGVINLSFLAHNEGNAAQNYKVKLLVMRPSTANTQDIVTKDYQNQGEVEKINLFPGHVYWEYEGLEQYRTEVQKVSEGVAHHNDVYKVTKEIEYYATKEDLIADKKTVIGLGRYYNAGDETNPEWLPLPTEQYASTYDTVIEEKYLSDITIPVGDTHIQLDTYTLSSEVKAEIKELYEYGCFIEGYITLENKADGGMNLSMPYMGFYSSLNEEGGDYSSAPVVEPFSFEKNSSTVYPSDLVNDIAKSLIGKDKNDMGSMWVTGYVEPGKSVNVDSVLKNDDNFANMAGFNLIGTDPSTGKYFDNVKDNLFVGSEHYSNTMIIQQFVLRSVENNFFTIKNKQNGKEVYRSVLEDMLFGDDMGRYPLYKSHVDETYLAAGYVAHRAYAVIPLYNPLNGQAFESGDYEITFNYLLAGTGTWVNKSYSFKIDSTAPEVKSVNVSGDKVTINIKEANLVKAVVGKYDVDFKKTGGDSFAIEMNKDDVLAAIEENYNKVQQSGRLFIGLTDAAYGKTGVIVRFETLINEEFEVEYNLSKYTMVQHYSLTYANDINITDNGITVVNYDSARGIETTISLDGFVLVSNGPVNYGSTGGCGGNIVTTSIILSSVALFSAIAILISKKKKKLGGK